MLLLPANEVWSKAMLLHLSVILFTGGCLPLGPGSVHPPRTHPPPDSHPLDIPPIEIAIEAGGTHPTGMHSYYRPQWSCEGYVFTGMSVHRGVSASVHAGIPHPPGVDTPQVRPPGSRHPPGQTPPRVDTLQEQTPPGQTPCPLGADTPPPCQTHPQSRHHPPQNLFSFLHFFSFLFCTPPPRFSTGDAHRCGWYASYWNAFLLHTVFTMFVDF